MEFGVLVTFTLCFFCWYYNCAEGASHVDVHYRQMKLCGENVFVINCFCLSSWLNNYLLCVYRSDRDAILVDGQGMWLEIAERGGGGRSSRAKDAPRNSRPAQSDLIVVAAIQTSVDVIKGQLSNKEVDMMLDSRSSISLVYRTRLVRSETICTKEATVCWPFICCWTIIDQSNDIWNRLSEETSPCVRLHFYTHRSQITINSEGGLLSTWVRANLEGSSERAGQGLCSCVH